MNPRYVALVLVLTLGQASAVSLTGAEYTEITDVTRSISYADGALHSGEFAQAVSGYANCAARLGKLTAANPGAAGEVLKGVTEPDTVGELLDFCQQRAQALAPLDNPQDPKLGTDLAQCSEKASRGLDDTSPEKLGDDKACATRIKNALAKYPFLNDLTFGENIKLSVLGTQYQAAVVKLSATQGKALAASVAKAGPLKQRYDKAQNLFQAAKSKPETSGGAVLSKYLALKLAAEAFRNLRDDSSAFDEPGLRDGKVGNMSIGALVDRVRQGIEQTAAAVTAFTPKADRAFAQQDAQIQATMPKLATGERLAVFRRLGIPANWAGGPTFSKNGIYSGDGAALARDIASATSWYYGEDSQGCYYRYYFNKNTVSRVDKPVGC